MVLIGINTYTILTFQITKLDAGQSPTLARPSAPGTSAWNVVTNSGLKVKLAACFQRHP